jgi:probable phosphoglycerate mutase
MKRLILVRHGETIWNAEDRLQGQKDIPLNETGFQQAGQVAGALASESIDVIYTSDLIRAIDTAAPVAALLGLAPIPDVRLRQSSKGAWEGLTWHEIETQYPADFARWQADQTYLPLGGESSTRYLGRLRDFFAYIRHAHPDQTVIAVSHGHVTRMLICLALGLEFSRAGLFTVDNAAWADLVFNGSQESARGVLVGLNVGCHLRRRA